MKNQVNKQMQWRILDSNKLMRALSEK